MRDKALVNPSLQDYVNQGIYPGLPYDSRRAAMKDGRISKRMQRDATAISIACGGRKVGSFAECHQMVEGRP